MRTEKGSIMETGTMSPALNTLYRGRKMKPGKYLPGPPRVFLCYCDSCNNKVVVPLEYLANFNKYFKKQSRSLRVRIIRFLASTIKDEA